MSQKPSDAQLNEFVKVVDEFMRKYDRLISSDTRDAVYSSGDKKLIADYESTVKRGGILKSTIEKTVGAWNTAKNALRSVQNTSSMYIGDAIDWLRKKFGDDPYNGQLGAFQIPAAVWVAGIVASAYALLKVMDKLQIQIEAAKLQRENPGLPRDQALSRARDAIEGPGLFSNPMAIPIGLAALVALVILSRS